MDTAQAFAPTVTVPRGEDTRDLRFPPALMEAIHDDPKAIQPVARVMAATLLYEQFKESGGYTPAQKLALTETAAKMGGMEPRKAAEAQIAPSFSIQIDIPGSEKGVTVSAQHSVTVDESGDVPA